MTLYLGAIGGRKRSATDSEILRVAATHKRALARGEAHYTQAMIDAWKYSQKTLEDEAARFAEYLKKKSSLGLYVSPEEFSRLDRYKEMALVAQREVDRFFDVAEATITAAQNEFANAGITHAVSLYSKMTGTPISVASSFALLPREAITSLVGAAMNGPLNELLESLPIVMSLENSTQAMIRGLVLGKNPRAVAKQFSEDFDFPLSRATTIMRTETMRAYRNSATLFYDQTGIVEGYKRLSAKDDRTCGACLAEDGHVFKLEEEFAEHPNGRCTLLPVLDGYEPEFETGSEWLAKQPESVQEKILGPLRLKLYKSGMPLDEMIMKADNPKWGPSFVMKPLDAFQARAVGGEGLRLTGNQRWDTPARVSKNLNNKALHDDTVDAIYEYARKTKHDTDFVYSDEKFAEMMKELYDDPELVPSIRIKKSNLNKVLDDGRFKSQMETSESGGYFNPMRRAHAEKEGFGIMDEFYENADLRPIYGYLSPVVDQPGALVHQYGDAKVILKKNAVYNRTTFSIGDSLEQMMYGKCTPAPFYSPSVNAVASPANAYKILTKGASYIKEEMTYNYLELQFHNQVLLEDIEEVVFDGPVSASLQAKLKSKGIPWRIIP